MIHKSQKHTAKQVESLVASYFGIASKAYPLPGDTDQNFKLVSSHDEILLLKVSEDDNASFIDFQNQILLHLTQKDLDFTIPELINFKREPQGQNFRLLSWVPGRVWAAVNPKSESMRRSLGNASGILTSALSDFEHKSAHRNYEWDLAQALWTVEHISRFEKKEIEMVEYFQQRFIEIQDLYAELPKSVVHNDLNDYNILVSEDPINPYVTGFIDFGDAVYTQTINDLAILLAYAIMDLPDPLQGAVEVMEGYQKHYKFSEEELYCLYTLVGMRLVVSVTKSSLRKAKDPSNQYHVISERPAWELLGKWYEINEEFALYSFRNACDYDAHPLEANFNKWAHKTSIKFSELFPSEEKEEIFLLDLKLSSKWIGSRSEFNDLDRFQFKIDQLQKQHPNKLIAGGYCEPRPIYTSSAYDKEGNNGPESRTFHLGIDFWLPAGTAVHALFDAKIFTAVNDVGYKEYGGLIILKHKEGGVEFYTLHGHLTAESPAKWKVGDTVKKGECIGYLGGPDENGEWAPHLHFQVMLSMLDYEIDFPGVAYPKQLEVWKSMCPDPNLLFKNVNLVTQYDAIPEDILEYRKKHLGKSLSLSYSEPLHIVRGDGVYLLDTYGKKYLDTVNNVAHVGHEHPKVVKAAKEQIALLNTNTRYLNEEINNFATTLLKKLPPELSVLHFVNSGSEANELALRMSKVFTGQENFLAIEIGYHGNTNAVIDVSSYKFDGKGGKGCPANTHILPLPDPFRGRHAWETSGSRYADYAERAIEHLKVVDEGIAGFIGESIISCGGQIVPPPNYFKEVYAHVREAGGLCIADEVQTGFGRVGKTFWAFELHDVIPDIVTMGKPIGNGHPLAVVACTQEVAEVFANGMEYFNTFGGNPVSCVIGRTVLEVIEEENLQQNALEVGAFLKSELLELQKKFPVIGHVRGEGLFLGFELTDSNKNPLAEQASYLANRMKELKILMSTDGPDHNVLKIKPPMIFSKENAVTLLKTLEQVLKEDFMTRF